MDETFNKLRILLNEEFSFHYDQLELKTHLEFELGVDSLEFLEILMEIEPVFDIEVNFDRIDFLLKEEKLGTIEDLVHYIELEQLYKNKQTNFSK